MAVSNTNTNTMGNINTQNSLLQQMKIPRIFAVSFGFCGCQSLFTWLPRLFTACKFFSAFLFASPFFFISLFVCWLFAKREICVVKIAHFYSYR